MQPMPRPLLRAGALLAEVLLCLSISHAQTWKRIGYLPPGTDLRCAYFWDTAHGVVGGGGAIVGPGSLFNYNSGVWTAGSYPEATDTVKSLRWLDGYYLYAASGATGVWKSSNRGVTWQTTSVFPKADDVFLDTHGLDAVNATGKGMMKGTSFVRPNPFRDTIILARDDDSDLACTAYSGVIWKFFGLPNAVSGYSCAADTCNRLCYTISDGPDAVLYRTTDRGVSWKPEFDFGKSAHDILEGANFGIMYVQGTRNVWRSTSGGVSWENIGGPGSNLEDRRMFAFGPYSRYLIVMDTNVVWLWDGGTGYLPTGPMPKILNVTNFTDTDCTLPVLTVNLNRLDHPDTVRLHAYTTDSATIQPTDTTIVVPAGTGTMPVQFQTSVPNQHFNAAFYFHDTVTGIYECGQFRYTEDTFMVVQFPSYPKNILQVSNVTDSACSISKLDVYFVMTSNPDTVRIHAWTLDGLLLAPSDTTLIVPVGTGLFPVQYRASAHPFQFASTYHFEDTVSGTYKCGRYEYVTDSSIVVHLYPPPGSAHCWMKTALKFNACTDYRIPLVVRAPAICDSLRIDSITWRHNTLLPQLDHLPPETLGPNGLDTFWVTVSSSTPGIFDDYCSVHATSTVFPRPFDTVFGIIGQVALPRANPRASAPAKLTLSNCGQSVVPFYLHSLSCDSVEFTGCSLTFGAPIQYSTQFNFPLDLAPGMDDTMSILFPPQGLSGNYLVSAEVKGQYLGSTITFDTTIQIRVAFISSPNVLAATNDAIELDTVSVCSMADTIVAFFNFGCDSITVTADETVWQPGWSANDPVFPFALAPDSGFTMHVHFAPAVAGSTTQYISYLFDAVGKKNVASQEMLLAATAKSGKGLLDVQSTSLQAGSFSFCAGDTTITDTLRNTGCDTLFFVGTNGGATLAGDTAFTLLTQLPQYLLPQDSAVVQIQFAPRRKGPHAATLTISTKDSSFSIPVAGVGLPGTKYIAADQSLRDFGSLYICESRDTTVTLTNPGCDTLIVTGDSLSNTLYTSSAMYPIVLPPNASAKVPVHLTADSTGMNGVLVFRSNSDTGTVRIPMTASIIVPSRLQLTLSAADSGKSGGTVTYYVILTGKRSVLSALHFDLTHNDDLLGFVSGLTPAKTSGPSTVQVQHFDVSPIPNGDTIGSLTFRVYLADSIATALTLSNITFDNTLGLAPDCIASVSDSGSAFAYLNGCTDPAIRDFMVTGGVHIESVRPNPAQTEIVLRVVGGDPAALGQDATLHAELYDALGRAAIPAQDVRGTSLQLDVSGIPEGIYFLKIIAGSAHETRQIVIQR